MLYILYFLNTYFGFMTHILKFLADELVKSCYLNQQNRLFYIDFFIASSVL